MTVAHPPVLRAQLSPESARGLTTSEVADLCRVSPRTVLRWYHTGVLRAVRLDNGHHRVDPEEVRCLLRRQGQPVPKHLGTTPVVLLLEPRPGVRARARTLWDGHGGGSSLVCAPDPFALGAALVRHTPSVVLFDPMTPGLDAAVLCAHIHGAPRLRHTGLVMTSTGVPRARRRRLFELGVDTAVPSPLRAADIGMIRRRWLRRDAA